MSTFDKIDTSQALRDAIDLLNSRGHTAFAAQLAQCTLIVDFSEHFHDDIAGDFLAVEFALLYPPTLANLIPLPEVIHAAMRDALPRDLWIGKLVMRPVAGEPIAVPSEGPPFVAQLFPHVPDSPMHNQAASADAPRMWKGLRFRSESELRVAQALDRAGILFLPNCLARLGSPTERQNREPDFLICDNGKWGILEVDGEPFHPPSRTVHDHERARQFKAHGVRVVEHFDAKECYENPDGVVAMFLHLLNQG